MKRVLVLLLVLILGSWGVAAFDSQPVELRGAPKGLRVLVLPEVELLLGLWNQIDEGGGVNNPYYQAMQSFFAPYGFHPALNRAMQIAYEMQGILTAVDVFSLALAFNRINEVGEDQFVREWATQPLENFSLELTLDLFDLLMDFGHVANFNGFFFRNEPLYEAFVEELVGFSVLAIAQWKHRFFGEVVGELRILLAPAMARPGWGYLENLYGASTFGFAPSRLEPGISFTYPNSSMAVMEWWVMDSFVQVFQGYLSQGGKLPVGPETLAATVALAMQQVWPEEMGLLAPVRGVYGSQGRADSSLVPIITEQLFIYKNARDRYPTFQEFVPTLAAAL